MKKQGTDFVYASWAAAKGTKRILEKILGGDVNKMLGERYVEEVFKGWVLILVSFLSYLKINHRARFQMP